MKKIEKQSNPNYNGKSILKPFDFNKPSSGLKDGEKYCINSSEMFFFK